MNVVKSNDCLVRPSYSIPLLWDADRFNGGGILSEFLPLPGWTSELLTGNDKLRLLTLLRLLITANCV